MDDPVLRGIHPAAIMVDPFTERSHLRETVSPLATVLVSITIILLTAVTVLWQEQRLGLSYVEGEQLVRHRAVLAGQAPNPWRYRVLAEWVAAGFVDVARALEVPRPVAVGFLSFRFLQNAGIFLVAFAYYRRLGLHMRQALVGVMVLAFVFTHALQGALNFNTYFDVLFYLMAALCVLSERARPFLILVAVAALSRETSGLIPLLPLAEWMAHPRAIPHDWRQRTWLALAALGIYLVIFVGLRVCLGVPPETWAETWGWGVPQGLPLVIFNLSSWRTLMLLALTFSILPVLAIWEFGSLPRFIKGVFWLIVPVWFCIHVSTAHVNETRLFLVPIAVVFIPGALAYRLRPEYDGDGPETSTRS